MNIKFVEREFNFSILAIFENKGTVASIAEKSEINYKSKVETESVDNKRKIKRPPENIYYFAVQHAFKQIDQKQVFKIDEKTSHQTDYTSLTFKQFNLIADDLGKLIVKVRNLNGHYLHTFEPIKESEISHKVIQFLKESFRLAVVQSFINEEISNVADKQIGISLTGEQKKEIVKKCLEKENEKHIVYFLKTMFYQGLYTKRRGEKEASFIERQKYNKEIIDFIDNSCDDDLAKAVDFILFVEAKEDFSWTLSGNDGSESSGGNVKITKGRYLSFNAMLFLFSMFLYKNEANALIPKISGFKKNGTAEDQRKLNVFLFYAKKFSSQDINCENKKLIFFRDIVQYIGKFPLGWNKALEGEETETLKKFKNAICRQEIEKQFPALADNDNFKKYAFKFLFEKKHGDEKHIFRDLIEKAGDIVKVYQDISAKNLNSRNYENKTNYDYFIAQYLIDEFYATDTDIKDYCDDKIPDKFYYKYEKKFKKNKNTTKLKNRIAHNLVIQSYARNQDRFLELGIRYLAETDYFGADAQFKMYKYYSPLEQQEIYEKLDEKAKDKLKFKGGKEVEYKTYAKSLEKYPEWDAPFVVENNAVFVKVKLQEDERPIAIQRDLMIYFLEDALFSENIKDRGANMLKNYFSELDEEKTSAIKALKQQDTVGIMEKTGLKKILPRRLLNRYLAAEQNDPNSGLQHILEHAKAQEERYERLRKKAIALDELQAKHPSVTNIEKSREALFDDKNKGKNFKLNFIRKACHIMYFKDIYRQKSEQEGHHKRFHITRDEYNNFCKWMYTFDTIPYYKTQLNALFTSKGFYKNEEFREIIEESENLNEIYNKVKEKYGDWLKRNKDATKNRQYNVCSYCQLLNKGVRYINVWHFKQFLAKNGYLKRENNGKFVYPSLKNKEYLFPDYYIEMPTQKAQHEDCLLYELVMRYFNEDATVTQQARTSVQTILNTELDFLQGAQNKTYTVSVPIKDVEKWIELKEFSKTKSLLERLPAYLAKNEKSKELRDVALEFNKSKKIALSDFSKVNNHIINNQAKFTCCVMALEKFYIQKQNLTIPEEGWLDISDIKELKDYSDLKKWRNIAFHFDLPMDKTFQDVFREIEKRFAKEICKDWTIETMPRMYKEVLEVFLNKMRNDIFDKSKIYRDASGAKIQETDNEKIRQKALREYLAEMKLKQLFN